MSKPPSNASIDRNTVVHLLLALMPLTAVQAATLSEAPEPVAAPQWCHIDDPAYYLDERSKLIAQNRRDLDSIPCPSPGPAAELPEQLVLPLPCGRRMVFRKISVPAETLLDHYVGAFGSIPNSGDETLLTTFSSGPWRGAISGSFSLGADGAPAKPDLSDLQARAYYLGKYEVTEPQYAVFTAGLLHKPLTALSADAPDCAVLNRTVAELRASQVLPAGGLSWYEAVAYTRAWNRWLLSLDQQRIAQGQAPLLPWEQGSSGYVRLPTETEWEFAARGGVAGSASEDQSRRLYRIVDANSNRPRDARIDELAVISQPGARSLTGGVGRHQPNLLGLYDMLGNVEEIVLDLFKLTRPDALHGQVGGYVVRGGSAISNPELVGVGSRREVPLYRLDGEASSEVTGMRLVVAAPVFVGGVAPSGGRYQTNLQNPAFEANLKSARVVLSDTEALPGAEARDELRSELERLRREQQQGTVTNERLQEQLAKLELSLEKSEAALQDAARSNLRERLRATIVAGTTIRSLGRLSFNILLKREEVEEGISKVKPQDRASFQKRLAEFDRAWRDMEEQIDTQFDFLLSMIIDLAGTPSERFQQAAEAVKNEFKARRITIYDKVWPVLEEQVAQTRNNEGRISEEDKTTWRHQFDDTLKLRDKRFGLKR